MSYTIYGTYKGRTEEIDSADTLSEARYLRSEYRIAFGEEWGITIEKDEVEGAEEAKEDDIYCY